MNAAHEHSLLADLGVVATAVDVVTITGPDAVTYLQGQFSQDVVGLAPGASAWSLLLHPTGKVAGFGVVVRRTNEHVVFIVDAGAGEAVVQRLKRFLLRSKVDVQLRADVPALRVCGSAANELVRPLITVGDSDSFVVEAAWRTLAQWLIVGTVPDELREVVDQSMVDFAAFEAVRISVGLPVWGADISDETIPEEANVVDLSVSFTKGCYTGQELVARIDSRGRNVPRRVRLIRAAASASLAPGQKVVVDGKEVGTVTSAAASPATASFVGLAVVARSVEPPARGVVLGDDGPTPVTIEAGWGA